MGYIGNNQILISVIVPCYGVEKYLDRCLESLTDQDYSNIEIILVDDKSPDNVPAICDKWAVRDQRIKVIHKEVNGGLGYARNTGLDHASGEYIAFVDSDDFVDTHIYSRLLDAALENHSDVAFCNMKFERRDGSWAECLEVKEPMVIKGNEIRNFMLDMVASAPYDPKERHYQMSVWHAIYKRSIIEDHHIRFESERNIVSEDIPFQVDFLMNAGSVSYITDTLYNYCLNGSSLTATFKPEKFEGHKRLHALLSQKLNRIKDAQIRADRFFIGYNRRFIIKLCKSELSHKEKKELVNTVVNDNIWIGIKQNFKPKYLCLYPRIFYWLTTNKLCNILILYSSIIIKLERKIK